MTEQDSKNQEKNEQVVVDKGQLLKALQERWRDTNGRGFLSWNEETDLQAKVSEIEKFLVETGILTKEDLMGLSTEGWREPGAEPKW